MLNRKKERIRAKPSRHQLVALLTPKVVQRFWSKIAVAESAACWLWNASTDKDGYGKFQISLGGSSNQLHIRSHRLAYFLATGELPPVVLHSCDTPSCNNPAHLFGGTQRENRADCVAKERQARGSALTKNRTYPRGENAFHAKLTDAQIVEIRSRFVPRCGVGALAREFGVSLQTISNIGHGRYPRLVEMQKRGAVK